MFVKGWLSWSHDYGKLNLWSLCCFLSGTSRVTVLLQVKEKFEYPPFHRSWLFVIFLRALAITVLSISSWGNQPNCPNLLSLRILTLHGPSLCKLKYIIFPCIDTKTLDFGFQYLFLDLDFLWKEIYSHNRIGIK